MKKKLIASLLVLIMVMISACDIGSTHSKRRHNSSNRHSEEEEEDDEAEEEETLDTSETTASREETESASTSKVDETNSTTEVSHGLEGTEASETTAETSVETTETTEVTVDTVYADAYSMYIDTIDNYEDGISSNECYGFDLINVDDSGIPMLVIDYRGYGLSLFSYYDGTVYTIIDNWGYGVGGNAGYSYLPNENCIYNSNADYAGAYRQEYYMYINDSHELIWDDVEMHFQYYPDGVDPWDYESYSDTPYYFVDGVEVSEEDYDSYCVHGSYETIYGRYSYDEIMEFLNSDTVPTINHFEVVMGDYTWEEACELASESGGHLATISSLDEYYSVARAISMSGYTNGVFYLGGRYDETTGNYIWTEDDSNEIIDSEYWRPGEPSYSGTTEDGRTVGESYLCITSSDPSTGYAYAIMDVPNDTLDAAPSYSGYLGYIVETVI